MYNEAVARMGKGVFVNPQNFPGSGTSGSHLGVGRGWWCEQSCVLGSGIQTVFCRWLVGGRCGEFSFRILFWQLNRRY